MPYARIYDIHIPMDRTDYVFKCCEYEVPLIKAKWDNVSNRDKSRKILAVPMAEDGENDPWRSVQDSELELKRIRNLWGSKVFPEVYTLSQWEDTFTSKTRPENPWLISQATKVAEAQAEAEAMTAAKTAEHVHNAIEARMKASAEAEAKRNTMIVDTVKGEKRVNVVDRMEQDEAVLAGVADHPMFSNEPIKAPAPSAGKVPKGSTRA